MYMFTFTGAVTRYYETKRQRYLDNLPARKNSAEKRQLEKKLTSRRRRVSSCHCLHVFHTMYSWMSHKTSQVGHL